MNCFSLERLFRLCLKQQEGSVLHTSTWKGRRGIHFLKQLVFGLGREDVSNTFCHHISVFL